MNFFHDFADVIMMNMTDRPKPFGVFHIFFVLITAAGVWFAALQAKRDEKKSLNSLYTAAAMIMLFGELYKQFVYTFEDMPIRYNWYYFPFQFCSMPLYTFPLCAILKKGKLYDALSIFNGTYCTFAGLMVILTPSTVFTVSMGINLQSMIHHSLMVIVGTVAIGTYADRITVKKFMGAVGIFALCMAIAEVINFGFPVWNGTEDVNMFFIAHTESSKNPLQAFKNAYPYPFFVFMYFLVFTEVAVFMAYTANRIATAKNKESEQNS